MLCTIGRNAFQGQRELEGVFPRPLRAKHELESKGVAAGHLFSERERGGARVLRASGVTPLDHVPQGKIQPEPTTTMNNRHGGMCVGCPLSYAQTDGVTCLIVLSVLKAESQLMFKLTSNFHRRGAA